MTDPQRGFTIEGFDEAVIIVRRPEPHLACWLDVGGFTVAHRGAVDPRLLAAWALPAGAAGEEWLLSHPDVGTGRVRLVQLGDAGQQDDLRADDQCWDHGGIFDLNVRVLDIAAKAAALRELQWHGASPPVTWDFGAVRVREWIVRGPDNVRLALIERVAPPLADFDHLRHFSQVFNSSQIVRDMDAALTFYRDVLGFRLTVDHDAPAYPAGRPNVLGLPSLPAGGASLSIRIVHPGGAMAGSIELVAIRGAAGLDVSTPSGPPHHGMAALRLPVRGMPALAAHLRGQGVAIAMAPTRVCLAPHGEVTVMAARSPEGAWLEFYEPAVAAGAAA
ncbi:MAG: VOC family protein [Rhodocyclaceae bacterium]|jgi:catechol 2,3-dioxygenase-like lactoylglutathione lyase family enzyme|nr:VOC family protein [Rhodocyclaceae bacterium]MBK6552971.1 VOC family protein [Rhodocyclaceae bacterium]MBK9311291.1 VOC family protein [Rhodocyclaceae bacterium]MBK9953769.1 VOC family protein [Rhodocyclaceae bacterium]